MYASEGFEALTGYRHPEILGQNCRFLQYPPGSAYHCQSGLHKTETGAAEQESDDGRPSKRRRKEGSEVPSQDRQPQYAKEKEMLAEFRRSMRRGEEAQVTITNYRKDGSAFINVLTAIPISWDASADGRRYIVGFQANRGAVFFKS